MKNTAGKTGIFEFTIVNSFHTLRTMDAWILQIMYTTVCLIDLPLFWPTANIRTQQEYSLRSYGSQKMASKEQDGSIGTLLNCIQKIFHIYLRQILWYLKLGHDRFLLHPFQLTVTILVDTPQYAESEPRTRAQERISGPTNDEVTGGRQILNCGKSRNLSSPNLIRAV